ncbi:MAG: ABC transporter permease [Anaerolineae bacterium]
MKAIDIALKDIWHSVRNAMFIVFGLGLPLATGALFYFAFGGLAGGDEAFSIAPAQVQVVNLDKGQMGFSAGELLVTVLQDAIPELVQTRQVSNPAAARTAVDRQQAAVAVIIPQGFTAAIMDLEGRAAVEIYQDPTLTLSPSIVRGVVSRVVDGFAGTKIAAATAQSQLAARGAAVDAPVLQQIALQYASWSTALSEGQQAGASPFFEIQAPPAQEQQGNEGVIGILALIMAGMMVFYVFFTGAASAQSILMEEEAGTLPRLFTTPTPQATILGGKFISTFLLLSLQVVTLIVISALIFDVNWGDPLPLALVIVALVIVASSFGIFVTSFLRDTRQGGIVYGGVMTVMGMIGMITVFTGTVPTASSAMNTVSLTVPQGWAVRAWRLLIEGGGLGDVLVPVAVMLAAGIVFFAIGVLKFRKRYA